MNACTLFERRGQWRKSVRDLRLVHVEWMAILCIRENGYSKTVQGFWRCLGAMALLNTWVWEDHHSYFEHSEKM